MISLMWKIKYNKCTYLPNKKTQRTDLWLPREREVGEGRTGSFRLAYVIEYVGWINKALLYNMELNSSSYNKP